MRSTRSSETQNKTGAILGQRQPATDRELLFKIERRLGQLSVLTRCEVFDEVKVLGVFKEIAQLLPPLLPPGHVEPRTGLPSGDLLSAHSKLAHIIRRLEPSRDSREYAFSIPLAGACSETIRNLKVCFSATVQKSPGSFLPTEIAQLRAPLSHGKRS